jgi:hypothetical protein
MARRIPTKTIERPPVWLDIMSTLEFWLVLLIFVAVTVGVGVLGLTL